MRSKIITNLFILCFGILGFSQPAVAQNASTTYSFENFEPKYELQFDDSNLTKKLIVNYSGFEKHVKGSVKGNNKVLKPSGLIKSSDKRYYFNLDLNATQAVGDFKYKVDLNDYNGQNGSNTLQTTFNVNVVGLVFDKITPPTLQKTYSDYTVEIPFKLKNKIPVYLTIDKPNGFNAYPIIFNDYDSRVVRLTFYVEKLTDYDVTIKAKTFGNTVEIGKINLKFSPGKEIPKKEIPKVKEVVVDKNEPTKIVKPTKIKSYISKKKRKYLIGFGSKN